MCSGRPRGEILLCLNVVSSAFFIPAFITARMKVTSFNLSNEV